MKADVQPWSKTPATHLDPCGWDSSPCRGPRETMLELNPAPRPLRAQLDFFQKLGYSTAQIQAAQKKFGTDTDKVLGELVRVGTGQDSKQGPVTTVSVLVPGGAPQAGGPELQLPVSGEDGDALRAVVIDGSNVAMSHGNKEVFSCLGIQLAVNFFLNRGHSDVTVFVPSWRKEQPRPDVPITDQHILRELEKKKVLVFTPSRRVAGKRVVCNDDCFIVKHAYESDGVVVSNDMYRDLQGVNPDWKRFIEERLLMYSFVNNKFMLPDDPLGRHGPTLENFLRKVPKTQRRQPCPYGRKCTYGIKCRFHHPERTKQSTEQNTEQNQALTRCSPVSEPSLGLVEDMPKKLSLKNKSVPVGQGKQSHRSGRRSQTRKKVDSQQSDSVSVRDRTSRETGTLDSGLGSMETMWSLSNQPYGLSYGSVQQQFCPPSSPSSSPFQPPSSDLSPFGSPPYPSCCTFPISWPAFSQPSSRLHPSQQIWSDPFCVCPSETRSQPGERSLWDPPADPSRKEREVVRKKLLAIFSAQLVDEAMDMSPNQLDPQRLVAKILELQNQHQSLR